MIKKIMNEFTTYPSQFHNCYPWSYAQTSYSNIIQFPKPRQPIFIKYVFSSTRISYLPSKTVPNSGTSNECKQPRQKLPKAVFHSASFARVWSIVSQRFVQWKKHEHIYIERERERVSSAQTAGSWHRHARTLPSVNKTAHRDARGERDASPTLDACLFSNGYFGPSITRKSRRKSGSKPPREFRAFSSNIIHPRKRGEINDRGMLYDSARNGQ